MTSRQSEYRLQTRRQSTDQKAEYRLEDRTVTRRQVSTDCRLEDKAQIRRQSTALSPVRFRIESGTSAVWDTNVTVITPTCLSTTEDRRLKSSPVMDGGDKEVDEPIEGVLVHRVNVGKLSEAEKQH